LFSRSIALPPNAGCSTHQVLKKSQKKPQLLCLLGTETQSLGGVVSFSLIGWALALAAASKLR
jgi:hypothetical protein